MPRLHTDDGPRRLRAVWLGPSGATLPFEWTYVQWVATLVVIPIAVVVLAGLGIVVHQLFPGFDMFLVWAIAWVWGPALGVYFTVKVMRHVTFDLPLAARVWLVRTELKPKPLPRAYARIVRAPRIGELAGPSARALRWPHPEGVPTSVGGSSVRVRG